MTTANPAPKKGNPAMKRAWESKTFMDDLMAQHGIDPKDPDALEQMRGALATAPSVQPVDVSGNPEPAYDATITLPEQTAADRLDAVIAPPDDLWWITEDVFEVHLVARKRSLNLRPTRANLHPPLEGMMLKQLREGPWDAMPFSLRFEDHMKQHRMRMKYSKWGFFCIARERADDMWSDERMPVPTKAVISHEEYKGWSRASQRATGTHRLLESPDTLREAARRTLQRGAGTVFIDWSRHGDVARKHPKLINIANPYGNYLDEVRLPVVRTTPTGDIDTVEPNLGWEKR